MKLLPNRQGLRLNPFRKSIGIDLSDLVVRAVQLKGRPGALSVHALSERQIPAGIVEGGEIKNPGKLAPILRDCIAKPWAGKFSGSQVVVSLPERKTFIKLINIPRAKGGDATEVVRFEATNHIPMNLDEVVLDWQYINGNDPAGRNTQSVLVAAAPKDLVKNYEAMCQQAGLSPVAFELESTALYRSITATIQKKGVSLIIDFGGSETMFILANPHTILFTSTVPHGGEAMTLAIQERLGISHVEAEKAKIIYGLEARRGKGRIRTILLPLIVPFQEKVHEILNFYNDHFLGHEPLSRLILAGAGSKLKELSSFLSEEIGITPEFANPKELLALQRHDPFANTDPTPYATAIGLALRELYYDHT